jgi:capsular polysaccharide biosynthesis protein
MINADGLASTARVLLHEQDPRQEYECVASLVSFNATNYYHWIVEHLPQLRGVEHYTEREGTSPALVVPTDPPQWMIDSLAACGYGASDWIEWRGGTVAVDRLVVPDHPFRSTEVDFPPAPENCRWLRERITGNVDTESIDGLDLSPHVYISREDADSRRVVNREALLEALRPLGFESYVLSDLRFEQQVALFEQAEIIVAPHGAGATNMIFSTDAAFVELCHARNVRGAHFFLLAHECGHEYASLLCEAAGEDMTADVEAVASLVRSMESDANSLHVESSR